MITYHFNFDRPNQHFFDITFSMDVSGRSQVILKIPSWRPGRYELDRFAKNIREWQCYDEYDRALPYTKPDADSWVVETGEATKIYVRYSYFAFKLDAGNSYFDEHLIYINPLNCCLYDPSYKEQPIEMYLDLPEKFRVATALPSSGPNQFKASHIDQLYENPIISAPDLHHNKYEVQEIPFHIWFQGMVNPDWEALLRDFKAFTEEQINTMGSLPVSEYHFFILAPSYPLYHGVEHFTNTVITLGPGYRLMGEEDYKKLIGISSHELFHVWNVKTIRPSEWTPYNYNQESPSTLGYIAEGVTTYLGDKFLFKSGVWDFDEYTERLNRVLNRHFNNYGRYKKSLAESSFETWLDGYEPGIPNRKVSIYIKGCVCALLLDLLIMKDTEGKRTIEDLMVHLYHKFGNSEHGITPKNYQLAIEEITGKSYEDYFDQYIYGTIPVGDPLNQALDLISCELVKEERENYHESRLGMVLQNNQISHIALNSPAEEAGLSVEDKIMAINGVEIDSDGGNINELLQFLRDIKADPLYFTISRHHCLKMRQVSPSEQLFFGDYSIKRKENPGKEQADYFRIWSGKRS